MTINQLLFSYSISQYSNTINKPYGYSKVTSILIYRSLWPQPESQSSKGRSERRGTPVKTRGQSDQARVPKGSREEPNPNTLKLQNIAASIQDEFFDQINIMQSLSKIELNYFSYVYELSASTVVNTAQKFAFFLVIFHRISAFLPFSPP